MSEQLTQEQKDELQQQYVEMAADCLKQGMPASCKRQMATSLLVGPAMAVLLEDCANNGVSACAKAQAIQGSAKACNSYTGGQIGPVCDFAAEEIIGRAWPYVESAVGSTVSFGGGVLNIGLEAIGIKDAPEFADIINPMRNAALTRWKRAADGFVASAVDGILETRRQVGLSSDQVQVMDGRVMPVAEMVRGVLNSHLQAWCGAGPYKGNNGGNWISSARCVGKGDWHLVTNAVNRKGYFTWASEKFAHAYGLDFEQLAAAMQRALPDIVAQESQNPETAAARKRSLLPINSVALRLMSVTPKARLPLMANLHFKPIDIFGALPTAAPTAISMAFIKAVRNLETRQAAASSPVARAMAWAKANPLYSVPALLLALGVVGLGIERLVSVSSAMPNRPGGGQGFRRALSER